MNSKKTCILTINGGSSSIKFALYQAAFRGEYGATMERTMSLTVRIPYLTKSPA